MSGSPRARKPLGVRCFAAALHVLPRAERASLGTPMLEVFESLYHDAVVERGSLGGCVVLARELPGMARLAVVAWRAAIAHRRADPAPPADVDLPLLPPPRDEDMLDSIRQDLRYALRSLRRSPGFTLVATATLALGIGANTAIFSIVNSVLLKPLPFERPDELVALGEGTLDGPPDALSSTSPGSFYDWQRQASGFQAIAGFSNGQVTLTGGPEPETLTGVNIVGDLFPVLGVRPARGRWPTSADESDDRLVVVLSDGAWRRHFGADPSIVGRTITLNRTARTVIGVMPPSFRFPDGSAQYWMPSRFSPEFKANRDQYFLGVIGRLKPGVGVERARTDMAVVSERMRRDWSKYNTGLRINVVSLQDTIVSNVRERLGILMGAVVFVLLIACANLGNLLLARSVTRRREMAVRQALGAGHNRLVRQLLTESLVLALAGGIVGIAVGAGFLRLMIAQQSIALPRMEEIGLDARALGFTFAIAALAGVVFGLVPALQLARGRTADAMREGSRGSAGHGWLRNALVVSEFALAMMLLAGAGLLLHSFARLTSVDPGLRTERLLTFDIRVRADAPNFVARSLERIRALPGVQSAAAINVIPVSGRGIGAWLNIVDRPLPPNVTPTGEAYRVVTPEYFATAGVPLRRGALFTGAERPDHAPAVVINEALARRYWPNEDPIGKQLWLGSPETHLIPNSTIVGVVGNTKDGGLSADPLPIVYVPIALMPSWNSFGYMVRTAVDPTTLARAVREAMRAMDPTMPVQNIGTMDERLRDSVAPARWSMMLLAVFAGVALALAGIGIFGVLSFIVTQRTRELGIRMALGAAPRQVRRMVVARGLMLALAGATIGLAGALAMSRLMKSMLFDVAATDPLTYGVVTTLLLVVAAAASYTPARRATRVDPMLALRSD